MFISRREQRVRAVHGAAAERRTRVSLTNPALRRQHPEGPLGLKGRGKAFQFGPTGCDQSQGSDVNLETQCVHQREENLPDRTKVGPRLTLINGEHSSSPG